MVDKMGKNAGHRYTTKEALKARRAAAGPAGHGGRRAGTDPRVRRAGAGHRDHPGSDADYRGRPPRPRTSVLLSRSPRRSIRTAARSWAAYAKAGIPVYWIVNLVDRQVEVYTGRSRRAISGARTTSRASSARS